jgi:hypothetical protein
MGAILGIVPAWVWAAIGIALAVMAGVWAIDRNGFNRGAQEVRNEWEADKREKVRLQKIADDRAQAQLDALKKQRATDAAANAIAIAKKDAAHSAQLAELKKGISSYVTPTQAARCVDVPRGYLQLRADAAAFANGLTDGRPTGAARETLDTPSGVSLAPVVGGSSAGPFLADTDIGQAEAFRSMRERVIETDSYADSVKTWCVATINILKGATP